MKSLLDEAQRAFEAWRAQGHRNRYNNPMLRAQAVALLEYYSFSKVSQATGVSIYTLRIWKKAAKQKEDDRAVGTDFIPLSLPTEFSLTNGTAANASIEVTLPNGFRIALQEQSLSHSVGFICALSREFIACSI